MTHFLTLDFLKEDGELKNELVKMQNNAGFIILINNGYTHTNIKYTILENKTLFVEYFIVKDNIVIKNNIYYLKGKDYDDWIEFVYN